LHAKFYDPGGSTAYAFYISGCCLPDTYRPSAFPAGSGLSFHGSVISGLYTKPAILLKAASHAPLLDTACALHYLPVGDTLAEQDFNLLDNNN